MKVPNLLQNATAALLITAGTDSCLGSGMTSDIIYTVKGRLHYEGSFPNLINNIDFTVSVSNCSWSITEMDGQGVVFKQVYDRGITSSAARFPGDTSKLSTAGNNATLGFENTDMPNPFSPGAGQIWLAYCSACKFSLGTTGQLEIVWFIDPGFRKAHFTTPASWKVGSDKPYLPIAVDYFFDSAAFYQGTFNISRPSRDHPKSLNELWGSFRVTAFTKIGSLRLPKEFTYEAFNVGEKPRLAYKYQGHLIKGSGSLPNGAFKRSLGGKTLVADERASSTPSSGPYVIDDTSSPSEKARWWIRDHLRHLPWQKSSPAIAPPGQQPPASTTQSSGSITNRASPADPNRD